MTSHLLTFHESDLLQKSHVSPLRRGFETTAGPLILHSFCPPALVASLKAERGLHAFAHFPEREHQLLLGIAERPDCALTLAYTPGGEIVGQVTGGGFVTGATMANFTCLVAARYAVLAQAGWDVESNGMFGAPPVTVVVGEEAHPTLFKSLGLAGFGRNRVVRVPVDKQGRMRADVFPNLSGPTIVCLQAGNVNTGAFDPASEIIPKAKAANAWVHVDGAFGLWAAAAPSKAYLLAGYAGADSWATDAHKYLNTPYDSGLAFVRYPDVLQAAMAVSAAYLPSSPTRDPANFTLTAAGCPVHSWQGRNAAFLLGRDGLG